MVRFAIIHYRPWMLTIPPVPTGIAQAAPYQVTNYFWQFVDHWQTIFAGLIALAAALLTIYVTVASANREVNAANGQLEDTRRVERRRHAQAGFAFASLMEAAMTVLVEEIAEQRSDIPTETRSKSSITPHKAYLVRMGLSRTGFVDVRSALAQQGGNLSRPFLRLDRSIADFRAKTTVGPDPLQAMTRSLVIRDVQIGDVEGLASEMDAIDAMAKGLQNDAAEAMRGCSEVLLSTELPTKIK